MKTKAKNKMKGISLIVLVITILVLSILAATVIISLSNTNIISEASATVLKSDLATMQDMATVYMADNYNLVDVEREYLITEFGITDEKYKGYEAIAMVKAGKVYIKPNAPENVKEVAKELNILIDGVTTDNGNVTLEKTATALKIYGSAQGVGEKSKNILQISRLSNFTETNGIYTSTANDTATTLKMKAQFKVGDSYTTAYVDCPQNNTRYSITITTPTEEWASFRLANSGKIVESSIMIDLPYAKYKGKDITVSFKVLNNTPATFAISDIQIEEGSTATEYIPCGHYKIPVTMTGKNLFDYNKLFDGEMLEKAGITYTKTDNEILVNGTSSAFSITTEVSVKELLKVGKTYRVSGNIGGVHVIFFSIINGTYDYSQQKTITGEETDVGVYLQVYPNVNVNNVLVLPQLEEGSTATEYEPYNGRTYNIYLSEPLRKVGDVADYVDCASKEVVRRIGVNSTTGELEVLSTPKRERVTMDNMIFTGIKHIFVNTLVTPSNVEVKY